MTFGFGLGFPRSRPFAGGPSLNLQFAGSQTLDPRITFTRASSGTYTNSDGLIAYAANDAPRFDYDPATLAAKGLLIEEQRTNLLTYSTNFFASWGFNACAKTANATTAPDGSNTGVLLTALGNSSTNSRNLVVNSTVVTYTVYVKRGNVDAPSSLNKFGLYNATALADLAYAVVNYATGAVTLTGPQAAGATAISQTLPNGWFRIGLTITTGITAGDTVNCYLGALGSPNTAGETFYIWGAQLEAGSFVTSYVPSSDTFISRASTATYYGSNGLIQTAAIDVARLNYNPANLTVAPTLLLENAATNLLTYSDGTISNLTSLSGVTNATQPINQSFSNSIQFGNNSIVRVAYKQITTTAATVYTLSIYVRMDDDSLPFVGTTNIGPPSVTGDFGLVLESNLITSASTITSVGGSVYRVSATITAAGAVNANVGVVKYITQSVKGFRITGYQLETGIGPTSYIPTVASQVTRAADLSSSAQATRAADAASMTGTNFSSWFNATEGTLYAEYNPYTITSDSRFVSIDDNTASNRILIYGSTPAATLLQVRVAGVDQASISFAGTQTTNITKTAGSYKVNDFAFDVNGGTVATDTIGSVPSVTQMVIGGSAASPAKANGCILRISYYPRRLSNVELQSITS